MPRPGRACSCYVVSSRKTRIALDCGTGAVASMRRFLNPAALDAVIVTHLHADHFIDLFPLRYLLWLPPTARPEPLDVYVHPGGVERLERFAAALPSGEGPKHKDFFARSMRLHEYDPAAGLNVGDLRLTFARSRHYIEAYAVRVEHGSRALAYSADTAPCEPVTRLARGADLFLCECALGADGTERGPRGHSNAKEAGRMAARAGAAQLVLTHYGAESKPRDLRAAARETFEGTVRVADDGMTVRV